MSRILGVLVLVLGGWAVWAYVLQPALQPPSIHSINPPRQHPHPTATPLADQDAAVSARAQHFLTSWAAGRYAAMYGDLTLDAQHAISETAFTRRYSAIAAEATINRVRPAVTAVRTSGTSAAVTYTVGISTTAVGDITYTDHMPLRYERGRWAIQWSPDLIFPGLGTAYKVHLYAEAAQRGAIVDRLGHPLAVEGKVIPVGVVPQYITNEKSLISFLSNWLHMDPQRIHDMIHVSWAQQHPSYFVPIATVTSLQWNAVPPQVQQEQQNNGLDIDPTREVSRRLYPNGSLASQVLGYVNADSEHGQAGIEGWADRYLSGHDGAKLAIANAPDFQYVFSTIKERPARNGATVHLTLDTALQSAAEQALNSLGGKAAAVVALRPSDGAVLAMASTPGYDPNAFATGLSTAQYHALFDNPLHPLLNRATLGQYPLGSVFKIVSMGAALEKAGLTADSTKECPGVWYGLGPNYPKRDWLPSGHGILTLHEALVQSCDTYFYQLGLQFDQIDHYLLPDFARSWGFGSPTGIVGVPEGAGLVPDPHWTLTALGQPWVPGNAVDLAIGQSYLEVTPLQVAQMLAALGNDGVMYRPYIISSITDDKGRVVKAFPPVVSRRLPISRAHRHDILQAMLGVTTELYGTAADKFAGFKWSVAGKTGTAETGPNSKPDAWFAALAPADQPKIALVVMIEHSEGGQEAGAAYAAPLARQILQAFFTKDPDLAGITTPGHSSVLPVR